MIPAAMSRSVAVVCHHPHPSDRQRTVEYERRVKSALSRSTAHHHAVIVGSSFHFPERRLIQYDCGMLLCYCSIRIGHLYFAEPL